MSEFKRTNLSWAPAIPHHWQVVPLNYVAKMGSGHTPSRNHPEWWVDCTIPWITTGEVSQIRDDQLSVITKTREKLSELGLANSSATIHPADTVVLSRTASAGYSAIMGTDMATSQDFVTWTCGPRLDPFYLLWCLRAMRQDLLGRLAMGSTHKTIYVPDLQMLRIPLPDIREQRRIADFLDAKVAYIGKLIELRQKQISAIDERPTILTEVLLARASTRTKTRLKYLLHKRPRYGVLVPKFVDRGTKFIRVNDLLDLEGRADDLLHIPIDLSCQYATTIVREGDILVSVVGTLGRAAIASPSVCGANVNRAIAVLRTRPTVERNLLMAWITGREFMHQALLATASDSAQRTLGMEDMSNFIVHWPTDLREQIFIANSVVAEQATHNTLRAQLMTQCDIFEERRQALIAAAVTGQIDVSTASGRGIED